MVTEHCPRLSGDTTLPYAYMLTEHCPSSYLLPIIAL